MKQKIHHSEKFMLSVKIITIKLIIHKTFLNPSPQAAKLLLNTSKQESLFTLKTQKTTDSKQTGSTMRQPASNI